MNLVLPSVARNINLSASAPTSLMASKPFHFRSSQLPSLILNTCLFFYFRDKTSNYINQLFKNCKSQVPQALPFLHECPPGSQPCRLFQNPPPLSHYVFLCVPPLGRRPDGFQLVDLTARRGRRLRSLPVVVKRRSRLSGLERSGNPVIKGVGAKRRSRYRGPVKFMAVTACPVAPEDGTGVKRI
jgi:hypothetical protein